MFLAQLADIKRTWLCWCVKHCESFYESCLLPANWFTLELTIY